MDLNNYNDIMSNVSDINTNALNSANANESIKSKITGVIGDTLIGEGSNSLIGTVVSPIAKNILTKVGLEEADVDDIAKGKLRKLVLRKLKQKLGIQSQEEAEALKAQRQANRPPAPTQNRGGQPAQNQADASPNAPVQEPDPVNTGADDDDGFEIVNSTEDGEALASALNNPSTFRDFISSKLPSFRNATDDALNTARTQVSRLANLNPDAIPSLPNVTGAGAGAGAGSGSGIQAPIDENIGQNLNPFSSPRPTGSQLTSRNLVQNEEDLDANPFSLTRTLSQSGNIAVRRQPTTQPSGNNPPVPENTGGASQPLANSEGGNIRNLASQNTGSSSGSGDSSLVNDTDRALASSGKDAGVDDLTDTLLATAGETAEVPVLGEVFAPLIAIGAGLTALFEGDKHKQNTPTLNPSYQFL